MKHRCVNWPAIVALVALLVLWEVVAVVEIVPHYMLPTPLAMLEDE